ncbi:energy-coupling factor ABC transporter ATP-binding protein [Desulfovermiculus halophilus]|jgi:biotin transport system ATP-binding protein|uniref:energy-coupling factor ABC transporter ATP-binding protein n=1 Tax=Desulfovermiculus halophilus TaxID=339722 RepID=UPI0004878316|nr:ABC transporter ATP-binding protein [Desulfovermiculus halophilus]
MIEISHLHFAYSGFQVLADITARIPRGACIAVLGANGSGKSTLLMLLTGLLTPSSGTIRVGEVHSPARARSLRREVGLLLQDADLQILGATVREDLELSAGSDEQQLRTAVDLAQRLDLADKWDTPVHHLSGGQKRKVCLAGMLLRHPRVLLYDEPFSGLDYPAILELRRLLQANAEQGMTQVVAAHDVEPLIGVATGCLVLSRGRLAYSGSLAGIMDDLAGYSVRPPCSWLLERRLAGWE